MTSPTIYREHGILFEVPPGWDVHEQTDEEGVLTITVNDGAAFWSLTLMWDRPQIERVLREARTAFEEEYEELDIETVQTKISRRDAEGYDIQFVCLELINWVYLRCFRTGRFTAFVMYQMTDHERDYYLPRFREITESLDIDQDGSVLIE